MNTSETTRRTRTRSAPTRWVTPLVALVVLLGAFAAPGSAEPTSDDPTVAADAGATWLLGLLTGGDRAYVEGVAGMPNVSATLQVGLALAATGTHGDAVDRMVAWFEESIATDGPSGGGDLSVGGIGNLLLLLDATGDDPRSFGGHDLVAALEATLDLHTTGLYGATDPTWDGVYRQSLAILGLVASGAAPDPSAVAWLRDQQCDATTPGAEGGWEAFRADPSAPCAVPDATMYSGADTNQTAMAVIALAALGVTPDFDALAFLDGAQLADGGFPYLPGGEADPNSSALVVMAITAAGEDPSAGRWQEPGGSATSALLAWQVACGREDAGAFTSPYSDGYGDPVATPQAVQAASLRTFPLGPVTFGDAVDPCADEPPTTTTTVEDGSTPTTAVPAATPARSAVATPVAATPRYTG